MDTPQTQRIEKMSAAIKNPPRKLAENPDVLACAVCQRLPNGSATVVAIHGDERYAAMFQNMLNIHSTIVDQEAKANLGKFLLRSQRDGNYILMTIMIEGCSFAKSIKRTMARILVHLNNVDKEYGIPMIPMPAGHLAEPPTYPPSSISSF